MGFPCLLAHTLSINPMVGGFSAPRPSPSFTAWRGFFFKSRRLLSRSAAPFKSPAMLQPQRPHYVRTTLKLAGTITNHKAKLDHASRLALDYSRVRLRAALQGVDPTESGVIRRALQHYARHLGSHNTAEEAAAVRRVCSAINPDKDTQEAAYKRLEKADKGNPSPSFSEVLHGPGVAQQVAAIDNQAEALAAQLLRERRQRRPRAVGAVHVDQRADLAP